MNNSLNHNMVSRMSFATGPDLPWQALAYRPNKKLQFQISRAYFAEWHEQILAELAAVLALVFERK